MSIKDGWFHRGYCYVEGTTQMLWARHSHGPRPTPYSYVTMKLTPLDDFARGIWPPIAPQYILKLDGHIVTCPKVHEGLETLIAIRTTGDKQCYVAITHKTPAPS